MGMGGAAILVSCEKKETTKVELKSTLDSVTYAIGVDVASNLKRQGFEEIDGDIFKACLVENINEEELLLSLEDVQLVLRKYFTKLQEEQLKKLEIQKEE